MVIRDNLSTFLRLLRGYRLPRILCFVLGMWSLAMAALLWAAAVRPMSVIHECEAYRIKFGADPTYRFGIADFHCEFQEIELQRNGIRRRADPVDGMRI